MFQKIRVAVNDGKAFGVSGKWFVHIFISDDIFGANFRTHMTVFDDEKSARKAENMAKAMAKTLGIKYE